MDDLALVLARTARDLGLERHGIADAPAERVRRFAMTVLEELQARGLLDGPAELDWWAQPRSSLS